MGRIGDQDFILRTLIILFRVFQCRKKEQDSKDGQIRKSRFYPAYPDHPV